MARRDQETDQTISPPTAAAIQYRGPAGATLTASVSYVPVSQSRTTYQTLRYTDPETGERRTTDVVASRESETTSVLAAINGTLCKSYLEAGISPNLSAPGLQRTIVVSTNEVGRDGPRVRQEVADEFLSEFAFAGQIGIQNYVIDETPVTLSNSLIHVTRTVTEFQVDEDAGVTKTLTTRYLAWGMTAEGRDLAAAIATQAATVGEVQDLIRAMTQFVSDGTKVHIFTGRDYGVQTRGTEQSDARNRVFGLRGGSLASGGSGGSFNVGMDGTTLQFAFGPPPAGFDRSTRFQRGVPRVLYLQWGLPTTDPPEDPEPDDTWIDASTDTPNVWDGDGWTPVLPDPPEDPAEGDTWRQDGTGVSFIWRAGTWVPYTPRPVGYGMAQAGAIWYEARGQVLYVWSGTAWIPYADTAPAGPSVGARYVEAATGIERSWGGSSWGATGNTWPRFTTTAPASPAIGAVWIDRNTVTPKRWDGTAWQPFTPTRPTQAAPGDSWVDATTGAAYVWSGTIWVPYTTTAPSSPATGDTYVNPTTGVERRWSGSAWVETGLVFGSLIAEDIEAQPLDALRAEEIDLPFPNDDTVAVEVAPGGALRRWLLPGEVQQQAAELAELENGIRYGTANGANVVVEAWRMPSAALAPFTVRAGGLEVQYLADGHVWEFDGELLAASCDGILCGAAARLPDEPLVPWVAGQGDLRALPVAAAPEVDALALPANTIATPAGFNPAIPGGIWNLLPTNGVDTFALTGTPSMVLPGFAVVEDDILTTLALVTEEEVNYSRAPVVESEELIITLAVITEEVNEPEDELLLVRAILVDGEVGGSD